MKAPNSGTSSRSRTTATLWLIAATQFCLILDAAIVGIALPQLGADLHFSAAGLSWVINAYALLFGGFLLIGGRVADQFGRRRAFVAGAVAFAVSSAAGAAATTDTWLVVARAAQGLAAAFLSPAALALLLVSFESGPPRQRALGVWAAVSAAGGAAGFLLGGLLVETLGWRSVFYVNVPIGLAIAVIAPRILPGDPPRRREGSFDVAGAVAVTAGIGLILFGVVASGGSGWAAASVVPILAGVALLGVFTLIERRAADPVIPPAVVGRPGFVRANVVAALITMAVTPMFFFLALFTQDVLGYSPLEAGLAQLPLSVVIAVAASIAPKVIGRVGPARALGTGLALLASGMVAFARMSSGASYVPEIVVPTVLAGIGAGTVWVAATVAATAGASQRDSGLYSGIVSTSQQLGSAVGLAILATAAASVQAAHAAAPGVEAHADGLRTGFALAASIIAMAFAIVVVVRRTRPAVAGAPAVAAGILVLLVLAGCTASAAPGANPSTGVPSPTATPRATPSASPGVAPTPLTSPEPHASGSTGGVFDIALDVVDQHEVSIRITDESGAVTGAFSGRAGDGMSVSWDEVEVENVDDDTLRVSWAGPPDDGRLRAIVFRTDVGLGLVIVQPEQPRDAIGYDRVVVLDFAEPVTAEQVTATIQGGLDTAA
jgi:EmrB/QacA subfamily drug resistance transporter